ncbi:hypothetical protein JQC72_09750 [Polycladomyces sp. WAk]|uniref:Uncharacterized protein n=1 Tax=Polycladomyces zharkentensis TaxID=2807616 RepID=A0ABS2WJU5_9BACL|nr:hypothetical protein [Polycladomyces sp. WAk]MBN2909807.1 hypothetical protein [Polycladomyces sp. WAk]
MSERNNQYDDEYEWLETRSQKGRVKIEYQIEERLHFEAPGLFRKRKKSEETQSDHHENDDRDT